MEEGLKFGFLFEDDLAPDLLKTGNQGTPFLDKAKAKSTAISSAISATENKNTSGANEVEEPLIPTNRDTSEQGSTRSVQQEVSDITAVTVSPPPKGTKRPWPPTPAGRREVFDGVEIQPRPSKAPKRSQALGFSGLTFDEDTEVDLTRMPQLKLKGRCRQCGNDGDCKPLWRLFGHNKETSVWCHRCKAAYRACSLSEALDKDIPLPTLLSTKEGRERRDLRANHSRNSRRGGQQAETASNNDKLAAKSRGRNSPAPAAVPSNTEFSLPSNPILTLPNLALMESILHEEQPSALAIEDSLIKAKTSLSLEPHFAEAFSQAVSTRQSALQHIINELQRKLSSVRGMGSSRQTEETT